MPRVRRRRAPARPSGRGGGLSGLGRRRVGGRAPLRPRARTPDAARRRHRVHRRRGSGSRRGGAGHGTAGPHPRDRRGEPAGGRRAERRDRAPAAGGRADRPVLPAGPRQPAALGDRRERGRMRRRAPGVQVRDDEALRAGARGRAADRRDHRDRRPIRQERGRLRPDATAGRIRGNAGDHHEDRPAAHPEAAGPRDDPRRVPERRRRGERGGAPGGRAGRAGGPRAHRRRLSRCAGRGGRTAHGGSGRRRAAADGGRRHAGGSRRRSGSA